MRIKLNNRRPSETRAVTFTADGGDSKRILVTIGFDEDGDAKEVFCASFKAGTALHSIVTDACILFSRLLQYGDLPSAVLASMCSPPSLIGAIATAVADCRGAGTRRGETEGASPPQGPRAPAGQVAELATS